MTAEERLIAIFEEKVGLNPRNKVARGKFTASFFLRCLSAVGFTHLHLGYA
ncbi:DUF6471 domain-containing protein [Nisaea sediminum]|uniref:DUF6471 domain-containing protein n=1 Tax=Nisaea sediminum TaxID=2775867 RepID=UPI001D00A737